MAKTSTCLASDNGITIVAAISTGKGSEVGGRSKMGEGGEVGGRGGVCGEAGLGSVNDGAVNNGAGKVKSTGSKFNTRYKVEGMANGELEM